MRDVWRPERRNRNIGEAWSGYSNSNDMRIPVSWQDKYGNYSLFFERLEVTKKLTANIGDRQLEVLYEEPHDEFSYGCSPPDVIKLLELVADLVPSLPDIVAFRQPTRKQKKLMPIWGRFVYFAEFGKLSGPAIILEAQELGGTLGWSKKMSLADRAEYKRLVEDGHKFEDKKRFYQAELNGQTIRNTILFRTLLHELGHWVQYYQEVLHRPTALDDDQDIASDLYFAKPTTEREVYAHDFAEKTGKTLRLAKEIPFEPLQFE